MWEDNASRMPDADGIYVVQTIYDDVTSMQYTIEGGWNTHREPNGKLYDEVAIERGYVARWYKVTKPQPVPQEWKDEYRKGVII